MSKNKRKNSNSFIQRSEIAVDVTKEVCSEDIKVSVIIPVYKVEEYIERCIDSLLNQTLKEIEFIFVDDCGGDRSIEIVEKKALNDDRIRIIYNEENMGEGKSRNRGIEAARGQYIGFVDSDDTVDLNFFEELYLKAEKYDSDVVKGQRIIIYPDGTEQKSGIDDRFRDYPEYSERVDWCLTFTYEHTTAIYRRSLLEKNQIKYADLLVDEDTFFLLQVTSCTQKIALCWGVYYYYYKRKNSSISTTLSTEYFESKLKQLEAKINYLNTHDIDHETSAAYTVNLFGSALIHYRTLLKQFYYTDIEYCNYFLQHIKTILDKYKNKYDFNVKLSENLRLKRIFDELHKNQSTPAISIVLPIFNEEKYIAKCLDSLLNQTFEHFEIICIDDGSTDGTADILFEYMTRSLKVKLFHQDNKGAGASRNYGLSLAAGRYVIFLDSDDYFDKNMLLEAYVKATKTNSDITVFGSKIRDEKTGTISDCTWAYKKANIPSIDAFTFYELLNNPFTTFTWRAWDKLYKKSFVVKNGLSFQEQRTANDIYFVLTSFMKASKITIVDKPLYIQRRNIPTSLQATRELSWECFYNALIKIREFMISIDIYEQYRYYFINFALRQCIWTFTTLKEEAAKKLLYKLKFEWFDELEILDYGTGFYENTSDYNYFFDIQNASVSENECDVLWRSYKINSLTRENDRLKSPNRMIKVSPTESLTEEKLIGTLQWNRKLRKELEAKQNDPNRKIQIDETHSLTEKDLVSKLIWNRQKNEELKTIVQNLESEIAKLNDPQRKIQIDENHFLTEEKLIQKLIWNRQQNDELKNKIKELEAKVNDPNRKIKINDNESISEKTMVDELIHARKSIAEIKKRNDYLDGKLKYNRQKNSEYANETDSLNKKIDELSAHIEQLTSEKNQLENELENTKASFSFKFGRAVTWLPRKISKKR